MTFKDIIGHNKTIDYLKRRLRGTSLPQHISFGEVSLLARRPLQLPLQGL